MFDDGSFLTHRRDGGTKVHPWYNGIPSGFPAQREHFNDITLLQRTKGAEESILFEINGNGIYVPKDGVGGQVTKNRVALLGLRNPLRDMHADYEDGDDVLVIKDTKGDTISTTRGNIYLSWEVETNVAIATRRYWPTIDADNVAAIDAEGFMKEGNFNYLGREKFHITAEKIANVAFDQQIPMPKRYKLEVGEGRVGRAVLVPEQEGEVYRFKPDDGLRRMLDAQGIKGWKDQWIQYEIAEAQKRLSELERI